MLIRHHALGYLGGDAEESYRSPRPKVRAWSERVSPAHISQFPVFFHH